MNEQRVEDAGIVRRRCGSCGEVGTLRLVDTVEMRRGGLLGRKRPTGEVFRSATCTSCGRTYAARSTDRAD